MKPRARRVTIAAAVLGTAVVGVVFVALRDHIEAWWFQVTRETYAIEPNPALRGEPTNLKKASNSYAVSWRSLGKGNETRGWCESPAWALMQVLANYSGRPVIFASKEHPAYYPIEFTTLESVTTDVAKMVLEDNGWRVLEQRFSRSAWIVIRHAETKTIEQRGEELDRLLHELEQKEVDSTGSSE